MEVCPEGMKLDDMNRSSKGISLCLKLEKCWQLQRSSDCAHYAMMYSQKILRQPWEPEPEAGTKKPQDAPSHFLTLFL